MKSLFYGKTKFGQKPITLENILEVEGYVKSGIKTLKFLKDANGLPLISGPWQIFVIGFYISALSILSISKIYYNDLKYNLNMVWQIIFHKISWKCIVPKLELALAGTAVQQHCNSNMLSDSSSWKIRLSLLLLLTAFMSHQMIKMRWVKSTQECQSSCYQPLVDTWMFYITSLDIYIIKK